MAVASRAFFPPKVEGLCFNALRADSHRSLPVWSPWVDITHSSILDSIILFSYSLPLVGMFCCKAVHSHSRSPDCVWLCSHNAHYTFLSKQPSKPFSCTRHLSDRNEHGISHAPQAGWYHSPTDIRTVLHVPCKSARPESAQEFSGNFLYVHPVHLCNVGGVSLLRLELPNYQLDQSLSSESASKMPLAETASSPLKRHRHCHYQYTCKTRLYQKGFGGDLCPQRFVKDHCTTLDAFWWGCAASPALL